MPLQNAIAAYHDLLTPEVAQDTQAALDEQLRLRGLFFGERPLCTVLRPRLLTPEQYRFLQGRSHILVGAFRKAHTRAMADPGFRAQFGLEDWEEQLIQFDPGFPEPSPTSRLDSFFLTDRGELCFTEYNAETPAAPAYCHSLSEAFYGLPVVREFLRRYELTPLPARHSVLHALVDSFRRWSGTRDKPRIAILDWKEVPTYSEFVLFQDYFREQGLECVIADPREIEYRNGRLMAGEVHVTLIYKRVLLSELIDREGIDSPVIQAVRERAACMVNPFRCKILHKKASLAVLSDEANAGLFAPDELQAIHDHIPWTRRVEERWTTHQGDRVDLIPFILDQRERLVLKSNDEYGGKGITLGWETPQEAWELAIMTVLDEPHVVQERIELPQESFPGLAADGSAFFLDRMLDTDPFVSFGEYVEGCLTRLSTAPLLNVTAGGGSTVPTFLVIER